MEIVDYILDGLEAALELERELGVRTVEIDRSVLTAPEVRRMPEVGGTGVSPVRPPATSPAPARPAADAERAGRPFHHGGADLVFLHDRPLSPQGVEMMAKIVTAMGRTVDTAPIVVVPPAPKAKVVVILGGRAMKLYFPEMKAGPGQWVRTPEGQDVLVTYSPEYILRFGTVTPAVQKLKQEMWRSLKAVVQRLR